MPQTTHNIILEPRASCSLNVRVALLVRDPRGTMQSRKHRTWCPGNQDCSDPKRLCADLVSDYYAAKKLSKQFPERFRYDKSLRG